MNALAQLSASTSWVDSSQRRLSNCKWYRKPNKCNQAPGCFHNGTKCISDINAISSIVSNCSRYDRRRRICRSNGCYFEINTRQCFSLTQQPTPAPFLALIETASSPSKHPTTEAPSVNLSASPSSSPTTSDPSVSPSAGQTSEPTTSPSTKTTISDPSESPSAAPTSSEPTTPSTLPTSTKSYVPSANPSTSTDLTFDPSLSPSASFTQTVGPTFSPSYLATQKPTLLRRSQSYCSSYHKKPRRCLNRGCLFDSSTLQCTNGVPTSTPSVSPSAAPTQSAQPSKTSYRVRLYWEQGYKWQEDPSEQWFCWACAQCKPCTEETQDRTSDCVDILCDIQNYCSKGMYIAVTDCKPNRWSDRSASFSLLPGRNGLFDHLEGDQIQVHNTDLCLSLSGDRSIVLDNCDASKIEQRFSGFHSLPMELSPVNVEGEKVAEECITQHHHPRVGERIFSEKCLKARKSDTNLWDLWTAY